MNNFSETGISVKGGGGSHVALPCCAKSLNILKAIDTVTVWVGPVC